MTGTATTRRGDRLRTALRRLKRPLLYVMSVGYVVAGVLHFVVPDLYVQIVPPVLPAPLALVYLSGVAEIAVGLGLLYPPTREYAAWGTVLLLLAVFPANVYMATSGVVVEGVPGDGDPSTVARWARLPLQAVLVAWAWWYTRPMPGGGE
nr:DoxX family protein [Natronomonas marina]